MSYKRSMCLGSLIFGSVVLLSGCTQFVNPWVDDYARRSIVTTPSAERVLDAQVVALERERGWEPIKVHTQNESATHWSLYWQDPVEDMGSRDEQFALTFEDYFAAFYCPTRFVANTLAFPVSAIIDPPGVVFCSDGRVSRQTLGLAVHDASRCRGGQFVADPACPPGS